MSGERTIMCLQARARLGVWSLLLVAGCGGSEDKAATTTPELREGKIVVQDSFAHPASGWDSHVAEEGETGYIGGAYRILVKSEQWLTGSYRGLEPRLDALRLEVDATQFDGTNTDLVGALCYTDFDSDVGYLLGVAPAVRGYAIDAFRGDDYRPLESSEEAVEAVRPLEEENQLRVECVASPDGPTVLTLAVNGETLVRAEDERGWRGFDAVGLFVDSTEGGTEALFDDVVLTELVPRLRP